MEEVEGVPEAAGVVASEFPQQGDGRGAILAALVGVLMNDNVDLVLSLELGQQFLAKFSGLEELEELGRASEDEFVIVGYHTLEKSISLCRTPRSYHLGLEHTNSSSAQ